MVFLSGSDVFVCAGSHPQHSLYPSLFIYLIILPHVCTCKERTDHDALGPTGRLTLHPWLPPSSAGQTLTLEQMDNGLDALSASGHTLRPPALATALPFTSCCPPFLLLHLSCPAPDCLNSQKRKKKTCTPLSLCFAISITLFQHFPHQLFPRSDFTYFNPITYFFPISSLCPSPPMQVNLFRGGLSTHFSSPLLDFVLKWDVQGTNKILIKNTCGC